jgi:uncharacterized protein
VSTTAAPAARTSGFPQLGTRRIAITGATGLVGRALVEFLTGAGHEVLRLTRQPRAAAAGTAGASVRDVAWDPMQGRLDAAALEGVDVAIHLAGSPVSERWTAEHKREIRESRVRGTALLASTLARLTRRPAALVSISAVGYYGDGGDTLLTEDSPPGRDFLAGVARDWEAATGPAADAGIRVAIARLGLVLSPFGGALAKMLPPFRLGAGGKIGDGQQWASWIALDDTVGALEHLAFTDGARGPFNLVAPHPVRNEEFAHVLGHVLHRPAIVAVPAFALKLAFGEMAEAVLLAGQRVSCERLVASGYRFRHATLEDALRFELSRE